QSNVGCAATLTTSTHPKKYAVILNIKQLDEPAMRSNTRIDVLVEHCLNLSADFFGGQLVAFGDFGWRIQKVADCRPDSLPELPPVLHSRLGDRYGISIKCNLGDARQPE